MLVAINTNTFIQKPKIFCYALSMVLMLFKKSLTVLYNSFILNAINTSDQLLSFHKKFQNYNVELPEDIRPLQLYKGELNSILSAFLKSITRTITRGL